MIDSNTQFEITTAEELVATQMEPIRMIVGDIIPAGLLLVAGDPKVGKSLMFQDLALSIATGQPAWGEHHVDQGCVLYLSNEGGVRSFRDRLVKMMELPAGFPGDRTGEDALVAPKNLCVTRSELTLGGDLEIPIANWLANAEDPRLVVIDTMASVAPETNGSNRHLDDYKALAPLALLATLWPDTLFVMVHHTNKGESTDVMHRISGSNGLAGATDGIAVLTRHTAARQCVFTVIPRNAEESELVMERQENLRWRVAGDDERSQLSAPRQNILRLLDQAAGPMCPADMATALGVRPNTLVKTLRSMLDDRQIVQPSKGVYAATAA